MARVVVLWSRKLGRRGRRVGKGGGLGRLGMMRGRAVVGGCESGGEEEIWGC